LQVYNVLFLDVNEAVKDPKPGVTLADFFPEVRYRILPIGTLRVACVSVVSFVERQEEGVFTIKAWWSFGCPSRTWQSGQWRHA